MGSTFFLVFMSTSPFQEEFWCAGVVDLWLCVSFQLALRAGNEKEEGETADTVGCCSLRVEHIKLHSKLDGQEHVVEFDFLGKDSIRYYNKVSVEKPVSVAEMDIMASVVMWHKVHWVAWLI